MAVRLYAILEFPIATRFVVHCDNVFHWRIGLDVVTGRKDVASTIARQSIDTMPHFGAHIFGGAKGKNLLVVYRTVETDVIAKITLEIHHIHVGTRPLNGIQDIDPHINQVWQKCANAAVVVV